MAAPASGATYVRLSANKATLAEYNKDTYLIAGLTRYGRPILYFKKPLRQRKRWPVQLCYFH